MIKFGKAVVKLLNTDFDSQYFFIDTVGNRIF